MEFIFKRFMAFCVMLLVFYIIVLYANLPISTDALFIGLCIFFTAPLAARHKTNIKL